MFCFSFRSTRFRRHFCVHVRSFAADSYIVLFKMCFASSNITFLGRRTISCCARLLSRQPGPEGPGRPLMYRSVQVPVVTFSHFPGALTERRRIRPILICPWSLGCVRYDQKLRPWDNLWVRRMPRPTGSATTNGGTRGLIAGRRYEK